MIVIALLVRRECQVESAPGNPESAVELAVPPRCGAYAYGQVICKVTLGENEM